VSGDRSVHQKRRPGVRTGRTDGGHLAKARRRSTCRPGGPRTRRSAAPGPLALPWPSEARARA